MLFDILFSRWQLRDNKHFWRKTLKRNSKDLKVQKQTTKPTCFRMTAFIYL